MLRIHSPDVSEKYTADATDFNVHHARLLETLGIPESNDQHLNRKEYLGNHSGNLSPEQVNELYFDLICFVIEVKEDIETL